MTIEPLLCVLFVLVKIQVLQVVETSGEQAMLLCIFKLKNSAGGSTCLGGIVVCGLNDGAEISIIKNGKCRSTVRSIKHSHNKAPGD